MGKKKETQVQSENTTGATKSIEKKPRINKKKEEGEVDNGPPDVIRQTVIRRIAKRACGQNTRFSPGVLYVMGQLLDDYLKTILIQAGTCARVRRSKTLTSADAIAAYQITGWGSKCSEESDLKELFKVMLEKCVEKGQSEGKVKKQQLREAKKELVDIIANGGESATTND